MEDLNYGWLVGIKEIIFEIIDGGDIWEQKLIDLGEEKVSFFVVSFFGNEGWIIGKFFILFYIIDGG